MQNYTMVGRYCGPMQVVLTFKFLNQSLLKSYLYGVSNPGSPYYGEYITRQTFIKMFEPPEAEYQRTVDYLRSIGNAKITTYCDRGSVFIRADSAYFSNLFHSQVMTFYRNDRTIYAPVTAPLLPSWITDELCGVAGLTNASVAGLSLGFKMATGSSFTTGNSSFPAPLVSRGIEYIWGSDLQVAYDEIPLLRTVLPTKSVEATILWSGNDSSGNPVGSFYPADISQYFNETIPSGEPHPQFYGVPLCGAPPPGESASYNTNGATFENTLDLEMMGSLAPGSSIYNVYSESNCISALVHDFEFILNPNSSYSALLNVSIISNSWYGDAYTYPSWDHCVETANALGITVLAASGDSGDNTTSSKWLGSYASFPGNQQNNTYGVVSVGGTTITLCDSTSVEDYLHIINDTAWFMTPAYTSGQGPAGTQGGICYNLSEPYWQLFSIANSTLKGKGVGVPDIGAIANNTLVFITVDGTNYFANPYFYYAWGTSIATPVEAGIIAEMDCYLESKGLHRVGFLDPLLFDMGNLQYDPEPSGFHSHAYFLNPFIDILTGRNSLYTANPGYDLLTGLGSISPFNFSSDLEHNFIRERVYEVKILYNITSSLVPIDQVINNDTVPYSGGEETFFLVNGTYSYNITFENSTGKYCSSGRFNVTGSNETIVISLNNIVEIKKSPVFSLSSKTDLIYLLLIILMIIGIMVAILRKRSS